MLKKLIHLALLFLVFLILVIVLAFCSFNTKIPREKVTVIGSGFFAFNSNSVLNADALLPVQFTTTTDIDAIGSLNGNTVDWSMGDYLRVRDLFVKQIIHDTSTKWTPSRYDFKLRCNQAMIGLQTGNIEAFVAHTDSRVHYRTERNISIFPQYGRLLYTENQYENQYLSDPFKATPIDTSRLRLTADEALHIAERNGGSAIRAEVDDKCIIEVTMLGWRGLSWEITYSFLEGDRKDYKVNVDGETGEVKR